MSAPRLTRNELLERLQRIGDIACGRIKYGSDFGRLASIANISNLAHSRKDLIELGYFKKSKSAAEAP